MDDRKDYISENQKKLAMYAKVMGHPVRVYIIDLLRKQTCCYSGDLAQELPIAKSTLSQHLKELKKAGLIQGEIMPPRIKYCLNRANWEEAKSLLREFITP
ncbi:MAG: ArsR family transcriptional regulator [Marinilabiliales bacterium]|nr:MAG: ArsR family transcriptional regulator [Marinilabiliales bacterium]